MPEHMIKHYLFIRERAYFFLSDEQGGERDTLTTLLVLALIVLPLIWLIIQFGDDIIGKAQDAWDEVFGGGGVGKPG